ncbi:myomegalin-like [Pan paniscus]|uniref:myomegalin-like n=1 Tax=Pan paniscus TaxID=9597 RepID=UPI00300692BF
MFWSQEFRELLRYRDNSDKTLEANETLLEKLRQRIHDKAVALERSGSIIEQMVCEHLESGRNVFPSRKTTPDSAVSPPVRDVGMNSPALVLPSSASSTPGSETAIINRTHGLGLDTSPVMKTTPKLEGDATDGSFANKYGRHVIGHIDDYSALRQQIVEGKLLVKKIVSLVRSACSFPGLEAQGTGVLGSKGIHELRSSTSALHHALEESASLLTMFWRAALPSTHIPVLPGKVVPWSNDHRMPHETEPF